MESDILNNLPEGKEKHNLRVIDNKINNLYKDAGIINNRKNNHNVNNRYQKQIDIINDVPGFDKTDTNLVIENQVEKQNIREKNNSKTIFQNLKDRLDKHKITRRLAAISLAGIIAIFGGATIGETNSNTKADNVKAYTDTNKEKNNFKESIYYNTYDSEEESSISEKETEKIDETENDNIEIYTVKAMGKSKSKKNKGKKENNKLKTNEKKIPNKVSKNTTLKNNEQKSNQKLNINLSKDEESIYFAKKNTKYTAVSDGSGSVGYFNKDSKVKVYNMALVQKEKNGNKRIIISTMPGESWNECAKRKGINLKEIKKYIASKDVVMCYSLKSEDGKRLYGWVNKDKIENTQKKNKNMNEERN